MSTEEDHARAGLLLLQANANLLGVFDGAVPIAPTPEPPYVVVYSRVAWPRDGVGHGLDAAQDTVTTTYTCHCVGLDAVAARAVAAQVRGTLIGVRPTVSGRNCGLIKQVDAVDPNPDQSTGRLVMDAVMVFDFTTTG